MGVDLMLRTAKTSVTLPRNYELFGVFGMGFEDYISEDCCLASVKIKPRKLPGTKKDPYGEPLTYITSEDLKKIPLSYIEEYNHSRYFGEGIAFYRSFLALLALDKKTKIILYWC